VKRALVVGLGLSGRAAALLLQRAGWAVRINDRADETTLATEVAHLPAGVERIFGGHPAGVLDDVALVVASPGVPWHLALLDEARSLGIEVIAEVELAARHLGAAKIAGVTGSNGKTTTTALLGEICRAAGWRTGVGGNIGDAAACDLALAGDLEAVVLELSSFQLEGCTTLKPSVALFLNLSPDHLDRHAGVDAYLAAKARIFAAQDTGDWAIVNADDPRLQSDRLIVVNKQDRRVMLFSDGKLRHDRPGESPDCWRTALGVDRYGNSSGTFDKSAEGDRRPPEGWFHTSDKPSSQYYGAIRVHYPGERHAKQALNKGRITETTYNKIARAEQHGTIPPQNTVLGGEILVHGGGSSADWTWGCIALNNHDLDELRGLLPMGMKTWILILP